MNDKSGFSLVELMVVIAILAIVSAIAIPNVIGWRMGYELSAASRDAKSAFQNARIRAIKENANVVLLFDTTGNGRRYTAFVDNGEGGGVADNWARDGSERTVADITTPANVQISNITFAGNQTRFRPNGLPSVLGRLQLTNTRNDTIDVILSAGGNARIQ